MMKNLSFESRNEIKCCNFYGGIYLRNSRTRLEIYARVQNQAQIIDRLKRILIESKKNEGHLNQTSACSRS